MVVGTQTKIRIRFGDRSLLEGTFKSGELIGAVYDFVKCALEEKRKVENFVLCKLPFLALSRIGGLEMKGEGG